MKSKLFACTSLAIRDKQNRIYHGRTMEYSKDEPSFLTYYPQGFNFQYASPDSALMGLSYQAKYNILCITLPIDTYKFAPSEGVNSCGLSGSMNMKSDSDFPSIDPNNYSKSVPFVFMLEWVLATCSSVDEIKEKIKNVAFWNSSVPSIGSPNSPFHFAFYDTSGKCIVIEASNNELHIYDNPTGVMTNGPEFTWHLTNLTNYTHLTNIDASETKLGNLNLSQPDTGIATTLLPSSDTSVGRFVRAVFYSTFALVADSADDAIVELAHVMNKFDRPKNMTVSNATEDSTKGEVALSEFTLWTSLIDMSGGKIYVRSYNKINYTLFTLEQFKNEADKVVVSL